MTTKETTVRPYPHERQRLASEDRMKVEHWLHRALYEVFLDAVMVAQNDQIADGLRLIMREVAYRQFLGSMNTRLEEWCKMYDALDARASSADDEPVQDAASDVS